MSDTSRFPLLVTGASGHLGRRVITHLLEREHVPAAAIIATTRTPDALSDFAARGVAVREATFDDPAELAQAFAGAKRLLIISTDAVDRPGVRLQQHRTAVDVARQVGAAHVIYTSMPKPEPGSPIPFAPDHYGTEQALAGSGLSYTVLRMCWYMDFLLQTLPPVIASGQWFLASGDGRVAYVAREDCARAAAAALAADTTTSATYTVTGPKAHTSEEVAALATEVTGKPIEVVQLTPEALTQGLLDAGLPPGVAAFLSALDRNTKAGNVSLVTDTVARLTGAAPQSLRDFLRDHVAALSA